MGIMAMCSICGSNWCVGGECMTKTQDLTVGLTKPTIHLNGTSRDELARHLDLARAAVGYAIQEVHECAPNGRDYYPQGDRALRDATAEHLGRVKMLIEVARDLEELSAHVAGEA